MPRRSQTEIAAALATIRSKNHKTCISWSPRVTYLVLYIANELQSYESRAEMPLQVPRAALEPMCRREGKGESGVVRGQLWEAEGGRLLPHF